MTGSRVAVLHLGKSDEEASIYTLPGRRVATVVDGVGSGDDAEGFTLAGTTVFWVEAGTSNETYYGDWVLGHAGGETKSVFNWEVFHGTVKTEPMFWYGFAGQGNVLA